MASGEQEKPYLKADIYKDYVKIYEAGLADWEYNTKQMAVRLRREQTTCPLSRTCDAGIRAFNPGGDYYSCGAFGDDKDKPIDFEEFKNSLLRAKQRLEQDGVDAPSGHKTVSVATVDYSNLTTLVDQIDMECAIDLVQDIIADLPEKPDLLAKHLQMEDWDGLRREAHSFKSVCGLAGLSKLEEVCQQIEVNTQNEQQRIHLPNQVKNLPALAAEAQTLLTTWVESNQTS